MQPEQPEPKLPFSGTLAFFATIAGGTFCLSLLLIFIRLCEWDRGYASLPDITQTLLASIACNVVSISLYLIAELLVDIARSLRR